MTSAEMIKLLAEMPNKERIDFLVYLSENFFFVNKITEDEQRIIADLRDGYVKVVENDE